ncbi:3-hydroxyacyl-CoA dehydrogenase NAD-binding domain-containing protein [Flavilitoribacter nigricans]|uniref:3-hydroxybutyryl-CoA dehydrogenase n=1 Tax=Flavilitoribacter nigricans (strain ATCC 23147 / DSM 23189 / NBRC 102662 / NCIMB 1420 / SS-2) TaxID=1122177 RepID=A0A2D0NHF8_FLAN2|nr:3-hydroxyacyl-CoA dehydrogenase NAD-binding domain-containing protein [Flavilitoribacter nigricans]PHN07203.1 3-hydroxybutyryl-CoA dehydrogenase [Flavilitoribacter nigricans DSM 23189 = NBRC 102662]
MNIDTRIGIVGSGAMGSGIAQVAALAGHEVCLYDNNPKALRRAKEKLEYFLQRLVEKGSLTEAEANNANGRIHYEDSRYALQKCGLLIEAVIEELDVKKRLFEEFEDIVDDHCVLATNTSSLSIAGIAAACKKPERVLGMHFFNPAPLMKLVEVIPAVQTESGLAEQLCDLIRSWGKTPVIAKDTPGFIVNRVARPFYGEAIRILEEGIADAATIDWAMTELGGFKMGPFALMDYIGHDVNYAVTESVFQAFFYDPRYRPSFTQKRLVEAGFLGRKTGRGFYRYDENAQLPEPVKDTELGEKILWRIVLMLINEAADALYLNIASREDLELAMTQGVNYPKGLFAWAEEKGYAHCVDSMDALYDMYREDRYRCSPWLRKQKGNA